MIERMVKALASRGVATEPARLTPPKTAISAPMAAGENPSRLARTKKTR
jgi:hypothetical protein